MDVVTQVWILVTARDIFFYIKLTLIGTLFSIKLFFSFTLNFLKFRRKVCRSIYSIIIPSISIHKVLFSLELFFKWILPSSDLGLFHWKKNVYSSPKSRLWDQVNVFPPENCNQIKWKDDSTFFSWIWVYKSKYIS